LESLDKANKFVGELSFDVNALFSKINGQASGGAGRRGGRTPRRGGGGGGGARGRPRAVFRSSALMNELFALATGFPRFQ
jgi:hypothetical protein